MHTVNEPLQTYISERVHVPNPEACRTRDNKDLVYTWMDGLRTQSQGAKPREKVEAIIREAYDAGYEHVSDGCTAADELGWPIKHPTCVGHDWLYYTGHRSRRKADRWLRHALIDFGHPLSAHLRWIALRIGGYFAWRMHRKRKKNEPGYGTVTWVEKQTLCVIDPISEE